MLPSTFGDKIRDQNNIAPRRDLNIEGTGSPN